MLFKMRFVILTSCLLFQSFALAKPKGSSSSRDGEQCHSDVAVCDSAARDDLNRCNAAGQSHCSANYYEDLDICTEDFNECMGSIGLVKGQLLDHLISADSLGQLSAAE